MTAHFRPAMNGEVYLTGEDVCRLLHITPRTLQDYRTQRLIPYISLPGKTLYRTVGSAAYAGGELRGHAPKAQTGEKSNINARGCASGNGSKGRNTASEVPAFAAFLRRGKASSRFPEGAAPASRPVSCPSSPARSAAWRRGCRRSPGNRSLPSCWSPRRRSGSWKCACARVSWRAPRWCRRCRDRRSWRRCGGLGEADLLGGCRSFGYLFEVPVAHAVAGYGKDKVAPASPFVTFYQLLGNLHEGGRCSTHGVWCAG